MKKYVFENYDEMSRAATLLFAQQIQGKPDSVLGLATGSTPLGLYAGLAELCAEGDLDFSRVTTYNLDEYYPITPDNDQSYAFFMKENLFDKVNIPPENTHLPSGEAADPVLACAEYERELKAHVADMQLLGVGNNGHIAFNEPEEALTLETHVTELTESTIAANARFFASSDDVPRRAMTMGMGSILRARKIVVLISGANKAPVVKAMFSGRLDPMVPATFLQLHGDVTVLMDRAAAERG